jgi:3-oxoacyl-[acyl-carrier-protein] synthase III
MRYEHVCIEAVAHTLPPHVVSSEEIERQLAPMYERLSLPAGRLELMTGITSRRFFDAGTKPGSISALTAQKVLSKSAVDPQCIGALVHGSVCRDQMEPATAASVHAALQLPAAALVLDVSNACLGLLNGILMVADMIELGRIRAGIVVGTETGRSLVEATIATLLKDQQLTRKSVKPAFASLTIGSGSAAILLCDKKLSSSGLRLLGGNFLSNTACHNLCEGGSADSAGDGRPLMQTDSEALLHAGIALAEQNWQQTRRILGWENSDVHRVFTHQVGRQHRSMLLEKLQLDPSLDYPTVETLGNTGAVALPMAFSMGLEAAPPTVGTNMAMLGIGSGLNSIMLGVSRI